MDVTITVWAAVMLGALRVTVKARVTITSAVAMLLTVRAMALVGIGLLEDHPSSVVHRIRDFVDRLRARV